MSADVFFKLLIELVELVQEAVSDLAGNGRSVQLWIAAVLPFTAAIPESIQGS